LRKIRPQMKKTVCFLVPCTALFFLLSSTALPTAGPQAPHPLRADKDFARSIAVEDSLILVRGGTFEMGDVLGDKEQTDEQVHTVTVSSFYLGKTEVTVGEFRAFITATGYKTDAEKGDGSIVWDGSDWNNKAGVNWQLDEEGKPRMADNYPVVHVSWNDAVAYCNWLSERQRLKKVYTISGSVVTADWSADGYRLPTEAEWEYAARSGGKKYKYAWGNGDPNGNIADETARKKHSDGTVWTGYTDGYVYASPTGSFPQGDLGLSDMTGNVWEWCWDWYDSGYYGKSERDNPRGPGYGSYRVARGGSWYGPPASVRAASRNDFLGPSFRNTNGGFRLARAAPGE
jgi:formylglycine-generating enzyme required for sulfatase activity